MDSPAQTKSMPFQASITINLTADDQVKLQRLVAILGADEGFVIRKAISDELFIRTHLAEGAKFVIARGKDLREINF